MNPTETKEITDADVAAWLVKQRADLGLTDLTVYVSKSFPKKATWLVEHKDVEGYRSGDTLEHAVTRVRADIRTPESIAAEKRQAAAKLLAEANAIHPAVPELTPA